MNYKINFITLIMVMAFSSSNLFRANAFSPQRLNPAGVNVVFDNAITTYNNQHLVVAGNEQTGQKLFFIANHPSYGDELWVSDGTIAGTKMVKDIYPGTYGSGIKHLTAFGNKVVFQARGDDASGYEPWISDGTATGTYMIKDLHPGKSRPAMFTQLNNSQFVFAARDCDSDAAGAMGQYWLWISDGTETGTHLLKQISAYVPGNFEKTYGLHFLTAANKLFFRATDLAETKGSELWTTDGSAGGTNLVQDINNIPGSVAGTTNSANPSWMMNCNDQQLFFTADESGESGVPWSVNPNTLETKRLVAPGKYGTNASSPFLYGNKVFFSAYLNDDSGNELFCWDINSEDATFLKEINPGSADCGFSGMGIISDRMFFRGKPGGGSIFRLFYTDGSASSTTQYPHATSVVLTEDTEAEVVANSLFFTAINGIYQLTDITSSPLLVDAVLPGDKIHSLRRLNGKVLYIRESENAIFILDDSSFEQKAIHVSPGGNDSNDGLTEYTPLKTFGKAIEVVNNSSGEITEIMLAAGTYIESGASATLSNPLPNLTIRGESAKTTIIKRDGEGRIINTSDSYLTSSNNLTIRDLTLRDATVTNQQGGAIYFSRTGNMNSNLTLERVVFENNTINSGSGTSNGGAIFFNGSQLTVTNCHFKNNKVLKAGSNNPQGGAVTLATLSATNGLFATFTNTTFEGNEAYVSGGAVFFNNVGTRLDTSPNSYVNFVNCTFLNNKATNAATTGGAVNLTSGATSTFHLMEYKIVNCTFLNNSSAGTSSISTMTLNGNRYESVTLVNNLIVPLSSASTGDVLGANQTTNEKLKGSNNLIGGNISTPFINSSFFRADSIVNNNLIGWRDDFFINAELTDNSTETTFAVPFLELNAGSKAINWGTSSYGTPNIVPATDLRGAPVYGTGKDIGAYEYNLSWTNLNENPVNERINIYPNPAKSSFRIITADKATHVEIFTLSGIKVKSDIAPDTEINIDDLSAGIYIINVRIENSFYKKILIKK